MNKLPTTGGVYAIRNKKNGKVYVGSTKNLRQRWRNHRVDLKAGQHGSIRLQYSWNKHGADSFEFVILEFVEGVLLIECEQRWLDFYKSYYDTRGYNIRWAADSNFGLKRRPETIKKMVDNHVARFKDRLALRSVRCSTTLNKSSGVLGVVFVARVSKWAASAKSNGDKIHLGLFATKEEAAFARKLWDATGDAPKRLNSANKSGISGVSFCTLKHKWVAKGRYIGKNRPSLGNYSTKEEAVAARLAWEKLQSI